ncbi:MAG: hypothetical protein AAF478_10680 [Pseudomonadota bacterium]
MKLEGFEARWKYLAAMADEFSNVMRIQGKWSLHGQITDLQETLSNPQSILEWWPEAFMRSEIVHNGHENGIGRVVRVHTKGWMPHSFQFLIKLVEVSGTERIILETQGDFDGYSVIQLHEENGLIFAEYDWRVAVRQPLIRYLVPFAKSVFEANHHWVMERGRTGLQNYLYKVAGNNAGLSSVSKIRSATFPHNLQAYQNNFKWADYVRNWN